MANRILVVSDIHSNLEALSVVIKDSSQYGPFSLKCCAGDIVGYGPNPNEVIEIIKSEGFIAVKGNHEQAVLDVLDFYKTNDRKELDDETLTNITSMRLPMFREEAAAAAKYNARALSPANKDYLNSLQRKPHIDREAGLALVHGSFDGGPKERYDMNYVESDREATEAMRCLFSYLGKDEDELVHIPIGILGHTHIPMYSSCWIDYNRTGFSNAVNNPKFEEHKPNESKTEGIIDLETRIVIIEFGDFPEEIGFGSYWQPKMLVNPGSVGQPRHGSPAACYAILEIEENKVKIEFRSVEYDLKTTQEKMRKEELPEPLIKRLEKGS